MLPSVQGNFAGCDLRRFVYQDRIIVKSILKRVCAFTACGWFAGSSTASPDFACSSLPPAVISALPSST